MSAGKKVLAKLQANRKYIPDWDEVCALMKHLGYELHHARRGGSGVKFIHPETQQILMSHKPHPDSQICKGARDSLVDHLFETGKLTNSGTK